jgi:hypothetical protein
MRQARITEASSVTLESTLETRVHTTEFPIFTMAPKSRIGDHDSDTDSSLCLFGPPCPHEPTTQLVLEGLPTGDHFGRPTKLWAQQVDQIICMFFIKITLDLRNDI